MDIKQRVKGIIEKQNTRDPFSIAKSMGIEIIYENLGNILGYYSKHFRIPIIHINENTHEKQQRFICAHELGHAIMHPNHNTSFLKKHTFFSTEKIELEANEFAMNLLFLNDELTRLCINEAMRDYKIPRDFLKMYQFQYNGEDPIFYLER